jgi:hypothetical protein
MIHKREFVFYHEYNFECQYFFNISKRGMPITDMLLYNVLFDIQRNSFAVLSVENGRKRPISSLLPCEMNFLKVFILNRSVAPV